MKNIITRYNFLDLLFGINNFFTEKLKIKRAIVIVKINIKKHEKPK